MLSKEKIKKIYALHCTGISIRQLAIDNNVHRSTIERHFKKNNLKTKTKQEIYKYHSNKIILFYNSGKSINEISKIINIPPTGIYRILKDNNIKFKKNYFYKEKITTYSINEDYFESIDNYNKAYILGFLYADGNLHSKRNQIKLKLQEKDRYILEKIKDKVNYSGPLLFSKKVKKTHQNQWSLLISNLKMHNDLSKWGVVPRKTFKITFPEFLKENLLSHFIRGYFDGDGCFYIDYKRNSCEWSIIGTSKFCEGLKDFFQKKFGIISRIQHDNRCKKGIDRLRIRKKKDILTISSWIYNDAELFLGRKMEKYLQFRRMNDHI